MDKSGKRQTPLRINRESFFIFSGADLTDYFNYGFTEDTWAAYCSRQKRMRVNESGVGMPGKTK